jgi:hypothetical protein
MHMEVLPQVGPNPTSVGQYPYMYAQVAEMGIINSINFEPLIVPD